MTISGIDHVAVVCDNLNEAIQFYSQTFGLELSHIEAIESQGVREAMLAVGGGGDASVSYIQLLEPLESDNHIANWLSRHGSNIHHIGLRTDDIVGSVDMLKARGIPSLMDPPVAGPQDSRVTFIHPQYCLGILIELVERPPQRR